MHKALVLILLATTVSFAGLVTPDSFGGPYCLSPAFGAAVCSIAAQYNAGGLIFSQNGVGTAVFNDPPHAWGGINGSNIVDLLAPVNGAIVVPGTATPGVTSSLSVEAGNAAAGTLLLSVFDLNGILLTSRVNGLDGTGPNGRDLIIINVAGIRSFSVSTPQQDTFGVDQITVGDIRAAAGVPEPSTILLLGLGLIAVAGRKLRTR